MDAAASEGGVTRRGVLRRGGAWVALAALRVRAEAGLDIGQAAPDFTASSLDGRPVRLHDVVAASRVTIVHFWASWCAPCIREMPDLQLLQQKLDGRHVAWLAINVKEPAAAARAFASDLGVTFPVLLDSDGSIAQRFGVVPLPTTFLLDSRGALRHRIVGATNMTALEAKVAALNSEL